MSDIEVRKLKVHQPISCKCGRVLTSNDAHSTLEGIDIVCAGCGSTILELHIDTYAEMERW